MVVGVETAITGVVGVAGVETTGLEAAGVEASGADDSPRGATSRLLSQGIMACVIVKLSMLRLYSSARARSAWYS